MQVLLEHDDDFRRLNYRQGGHSLYSLTSLSTGNAVTVRTAPRPAPIDQMGQQFSAGENDSIVHFCPMLTRRRSEQAIFVITVTQN